MVPGLAAACASICARWARRSARTPSSASSTSAPSISSPSATGASIGGKIKLVQRARRRQRAHHRHDRHRRRRLHRHLLRDRGRLRHRRGRRAARPHRDCRRARTSAPGKSGTARPARHVGMVDPRRAAPSTPTPRPRARSLHDCSSTSPLLLVIPPLGLLPIFPAFWVFDQHRRTGSASSIAPAIYMASIPLMAWPTAFALVLVTVGFIVAVRWIVLPRVQRGHLFGPLLVLRAQVDGGARHGSDARDAVLALRHDLHAQLVSPDGREDRQGRRRSPRTSPAATISSRSARNLHRRRGRARRRGHPPRLDVSRTRRRRAPACSSATTRVVPPGAVIPEGALIGIKSKPPANELMSPGDTWFGSPPIKLPVRQKFRRRRRQLDLRAAVLEASFCARSFEAVHISLPTMLFITFGTWAIELISEPLLDGRLRHGVLAVHGRRARDDRVHDRWSVVAVKWLTDGPLRAGREADVVVVGHAHGSRRGALLGPRRQGAARASARHAVPALGAAPVRREDRQGRLHGHDRHHRVRLRARRRFLRR